jgi:hypothetical protein
MATWKGEAWLGSASGRQTVTVQSNTFQGAMEQIQQIYGTRNVWNLREVRSSNSQSSSGDFGSYLTLAAIIFCIWLVVEYWWIVTPIVVIALIAYLINKFN